MIPFGAATGGPGSISLSASFGAISTTTGTPAANANVTLTMGASRTIDVAHSLAGDFEYRVNSGTYTNCPTGTDISVANGDTLNFRHNADMAAGPGVVTLTDNLLGSLLALFSVTVS